MTAPVSARYHVMQIEIPRRPAAGHDTPAVVAALDLTPHGRRHRIDHRRRRIAIDAADLLRVAARPRHRRRADLDDLAGGVLPAAIAALADRERDLRPRT